MIADGRYALHHKYPADVDPNEPSVAFSLGWADKDAGEVGHCGRPPGPGRDSGPTRTSSGARVPRTSRSTSFVTRSPGTPWTAAPSTGCSTTGSASPERVKRARTCVHVGWTCVTSRVPAASTTRRRKPVRPRPAGSAPPIPSSVTTISRTSSPIMQRRVPGPRGVPDGVGERLGRDEPGGVSGAVVLPGARTLDLDMCADAGPEILQARPETRLASTSSRSPDTAPARSERAATTSSCACRTAATTSSGDPIGQQPERFVEDVERALEPVLRSVGHLGRHLPTFSKVRVDETPA